MARKIALISEHASPLVPLGSVDSGGQNVYVGQIARQLARRGHRVDVFTRRDSKRRPAVIEWLDGVRIVQVPAGPASFVRKEEMFPYMEEFSEYCVRFFRREPTEYDIVHANFWMSGLVGLHIKRELGVPLAITFHALGRVRRQHQGKADEFPDTRFSIEDEIVKHVDCIIAECSQDLEDLLLLYKADKTKIRVVPCGFDPDEFEPVDKAAARLFLNLPAEGFIVLHLGRIVPRKGVDTTILGFSKFLTETKTEGYLIIAGGQSPGPTAGVDREVERLTGITFQEHIADRVIFAGRVERERLKYYYSAADVFVTLPWYEPFGITPLEAMACGRPVIGSNVGGLRYSVEDGESGYLIPSREPTALSNCLSHLLDHPDLIDCMGEKGRKRVHELFTWKKVADSLENVYEGIIAGRIGYARRRTQGPCEDVIDRAFAAALETFNKCRPLGSDLIKISDQIQRCLARGNKLLVCGNGGSAADSQHFVGELVGRLQHPRRPALGAVALTADTAFLTAWSNDMGYEDVFSRQVEALGKEGDILVVISTSGRSLNLIKACEKAHQMGLLSVALLGRDGGSLATIADTAIIVPSDDSQRIQESHLLFLHVLSELVEEWAVSGLTQPIPKPSREAVLSENLP